MQRMVRPQTPLLFAAGAIVALALAIVDWIGMTGLYGGTDRVLQDTYYVVAHSSYVLKLAVLFAVLAVWYFAFPKVTGWAYSELLGKVHFWLWVVGIVASSFPFLILPGLLRQAVDDPDVFWRWNLISAIGAYLVVAGALVFLVNMVLAFVRRSRSS